MAKKPVSGAAKTTQPKQVVRCPKGHEASWVRYAPRAGNGPMVWFCIPCGERVD